MLQCLPHTLGLANEKWRVLDQAHRKRNLNEYEGSTDIEEALIRVTSEVARLVSNE